MQRVANCILTVDDQVLLLQKPRYGWWVAPGGKMEEGETIKETVEREFHEETGLYLNDPTLRAVSTIVMMENDEVLNEWMMFTFQSHRCKGTLRKESPEGHLAWQHREDVLNLPKAAGDQFIFEHVLHNKGILYGTFYYTKDFQLLSYRLDTNLYERHER